MPDPRLVSRAQRAATILERAWERWRAEQGLIAEPLPPISSYVGYSIEEPWGRPRVVFGVSAEDAERLSALLEESAQRFRDGGHGPDEPGYRAPVLAGPAGDVPVPPDRGLDQQSLFEDVRGRIPVQGWPAEFTESRDQLNSAWPSSPPGSRGRRAPVEPPVPGDRPVAGPSGDSGPELDRGAAPAVMEEPAGPPATGRSGAVPAGAGLGEASPAGAGLGEAAPAGAGLGEAAPAGAGLGEAAPAGASLTDAAPAGAGLDEAAPAGAGLGEAALAGAGADGAELPGSERDEAQPCAARPGGAEPPAAELDEADADDSSPGTERHGRHVHGAGPDPAGGNAAGPDGGAPGARPQDRVPGDHGLPGGEDVPAAPFVPDAAQDAEAPEPESTRPPAGPVDSAGQASITDTMAAELAGWAAGELPGQASARLAAWTTVGGAVARGRQQSSHGGSGTATERVG